MVSSSFHVGETARTRGNWNDANADLLLDRILFSFSVGTGLHTHGNYFNHTHNPESGGYFDGAMGVTQWFVAFSTLLVLLPPQTLNSVLLHAALSLQARLSPTRFLQTCRKEPTGFMVSLFASFA